jgi:hypothetical protein
MDEKQGLKEKLEKADIQANLKRVDYLLKESTDVPAHALGMKLALLMAQEIAEGKAPGSDTSAIMAEWTQKHPASIVEEAVHFARQFLLEPQKLVDELSKRLWSEQK